MDRRATPPERIETGALVLRRLLPEDAPVVAWAASASLHHLRPFLPWAIPESVTVDAQRERLESFDWSWAPESEHFGYGIFYPGAEASMVGSCGLHARRDPGALEIGYWVHVDHVRRGIATTAARAMTEAGFTVAGIDRMEILCDVANQASAGVPRKLGYRLVETIDHEIVAPGETGKRLVWVMSREEWCGTADG